MTIFLVTGTLLYYPAILNMKEKCTPKQHYTYIIYTIYLEHCVAFILSQHPKGSKQYQKVKSEQEISPCSNSLQRFICYISLTGEGLSSDKAAELKHCFTVLRKHALTTRVYNMNNVHPLKTTIAFCGKLHRLHNMPRSSP